MLCREVPEKSKLDIRRRKSVWEGWESRLRGEYRLRMEVDLLWFSWDKN